MRRCHCCVRMCTLLISESLPPCVSLHVLRSALELVFTAFFTTELALRYLATRETDTPFWSDVYVWFDIIAIIPFYFMVLACFGNPFSASCDLGDNFFISVLQATRILRVFKISRVRPHRCCAVR